MFYLINLLVYGAVDVMACLGLSQQFGNMPLRLVFTFFVLCIP